MKKENFFDKAQQERIIHAVTQTERITCGEILPVVTKRSDFYYHAHLVVQIIGSIFLTVITLPFSIITSLFQPNWTVQWNSQMLSLELSLFEFLLTPFLLVLFFTVLGLFPISSPFLTRLFVSKKTRQEAVKKAAQQQFTKQKVNYTEENSGILIYISLLEKQIEIIADKGIHSAVKDHFWQARADEIAKAMKKGLGVTQLCNSIETIGIELKTNFPVRSNDENELPNLIIEK